MRTPSGDDWSTWELRIRAEERKLGAERERRRIRRAQAGVRERMNNLAAWDACPEGPKRLAALAVEVMNNSTRAPRAKRRRGK